MVSVDRGREVDPIWYRVLGRRRGAVDGCISGGPVELRLVVARDEVYGDVASFRGHHSGADLIEAGHRLLSLDLSHPLKYSIFKNGF